MSTTVNSPKPVKTKRLSIPRLIIALVVSAALVTAGVGAARTWWTSATTPPNADPWFAAYVDVTATPSYAFESPVSDAAKNVVLSFIVTKAGEDCTPSWGSVYTMDEAATSLDLDRRIARLQQQGGEPVISFGGLSNDELATTCTDVDELAAAYQSVIDRYGITTIDLDIEAGNLADSEASVRRAKAIAIVQKNEKADDENLAVWLTLPVAPTGLTEVGTTTVSDFLAADVDLSGVNVMTMDYGDSRVDGQTMLDASTSALDQTHRQLGVLYQLADIDLTSETVWSKIGATPMIGQNDVEGEIFTLDDARKFNAYAVSHGVGRVSMWSLNRDATCGSNYDVRRVADSCSGVAQGDFSFATILASKLTGNPEAASATETTSEPVPVEEADDPATSPYPIWTTNSTYLVGTKVVWHRNVYAAKWWTRGDLPDNPVLDAWETPWELVGPVLEGETPVVSPTLPDGTYPVWAGTSVYEEGARVVVDDYVFEAKWWNQGDSPAASTTDPDNSPWVRLTDAQIQEVLDEIAAGQTPTGAATPTATPTPSPTATPAS
jgi:chitinase